MRKLAAVGFITGMALSAGLPLGAFREPAPYEYRAKAKHRRGQRRGESYYYDHAHAYGDRRSLREVWKALISLYNTPDKTTLAREVLSRAEVYDGMRDAEEFEASRDLFGMVVWVDASQRVGSVDPSMGIKAEGGMWNVDNNGTLDDLTAEVHTLAKWWGLSPATS